MPRQSLVDDTLKSGAVYVSLPRAALILDLSERAVRRYIAAGKLPAYKLGNRHVRIKLADLDALMRPIPAGGQDYVGAPPAAIQQAGDHYAA